MSNLRPNLPPGVFANPPRWKTDVVTADEGKTFGYGPSVRRQRFADVEDTFNPGALVFGWWSWMLEWRWGRRAWLLYRWRERVA